MAATSNPETLKNLEDGVSRHTLDYSKLLEQGLNVMIANQLDSLFKNEILAFSDLNDTVFEALRKLPTDEVSNSLAQLTKMNFGCISNKTEYLNELLNRYGPNPKLMTHILEDSDDFTLIVTASERTITVFEDLPEKQNQGYELFCTNIPETIFEDELLQLFDDGGEKEILQLKLVMSPTTNYNTGVAFIIYSEKNAAEEMQKKLNNYEIRRNKTLNVRLSVPDYKKLYVRCDSSLDQKENAVDKLSELEGLNKTADGNNAIVLFNDERDAALAKEKLSSYGVIVDWAKSSDFPFEANNVHVCQVSSVVSYCCCIDQLLSKISSLVNEIRSFEMRTNNAVIDNAKNQNRIKYACHSLRLENLDTDEQSLKNILDATNYALTNMSSKNDSDGMGCNLNVETILKLHQILEPNIEKSGVFRDDEDYVYINGIYNIPVYPSPVESLHAEIEEFVELMNNTLITDDVGKSVLMAATAKTKFCLTHPMVDGNGRISRSLFSAVLEKKNFPAIVIPLSESTRYYEALKVAHFSDPQDFTLIYRFLCQCVQKSLQIYLDNLKLSFY